MTIEDKIKDRYTELRRGHQPSYKSSDRISGPAWDKAAEIVRRIDADPAMFVEAQFDAYSTRAYGDRFPQPNQMFSASAAEIYQKYAESRGSTPDAMMKQQVTLLTDQLNQRSTLIDIDRVLTSPSLDFRSWFRVLMCSDTNFPVFREMWGSAATKQIIKSPQLYEFIKQKYAARANRFS